MPNCIKLEWAKDPQLTPCAIGEPVNFIGLKVLATNDDGSQELVDVNQRMVNESSLQTTASIRKSMLIYAGQRLPMLVPVLNIMLDHIQVTTEGTPCGREGEPFDRTQISVIAFYSDGTSKQVEHYKVSPGRELKKNTTEITIKYGRCNEVLPIMVLGVDEVPPTEALIVTKENLLKKEPGNVQDVCSKQQSTDTPPKTSQGEPKQPVLVGSATQPTTDTAYEKRPSAFISGASMGKVENRVLQVVSIAQLPTKLKYSVGETKADLSGGRLNLIYADGTIEQVDMIADGAINVACSISGRGCVAFTYKGKPITYPIEVIAPAVAIGLQLTKMPEKLVYEQGTLEVDMTGAELTVHLSDGSDETVNVTTDMIGPFNFAEVGKSNVFIMCHGFSVLCPVVVIPKASGPQKIPVTPTSSLSEKGNDTVAAAFVVPTVKANEEPRTGDLIQNEDSTSAESRPEAERQTETLTSSTEISTITGDNIEDSAKPAPAPTKPVPDFYVSTFGLRFNIEECGTN